MDNVPLRLIFLAGLALWLIGGDVLGPVGDHLAPRLLTPRPVEDWPGGENSLGPRAAVTTARERSRVNRVHPLKRSVMAAFPGSFGACLKLMTRCRCYARALCSSKT